MKNDDSVEKCYGVKDQERLACDPEDVIAMMFEGSTEALASFVFPLEIHVFQRQTISISGSEILNDVLENLDENYGDPDGDDTSPTDKMLEAANILADTIKKDYVCWMCESTDEILAYSKEDVLTILKKYS